MLKKVRVTADAAGNVIVISKDSPEWGYIRVRQERLLVDAEGFTHTKPLSALIVGKIPDLKKYGYVAGQEIEGKVTFKDSMKAFNKNEPEKDYKRAGKTGIVCCVDGAPIYRKNFYNDSPEAQDVAIDHTNGDEIKAAYAAMKEKAGEDIDKM